MTPGRLQIGHDMTVFNLISPPGTFFSTDTALDVDCADGLDSERRHMRARSAGPADHDARTGFQIDLSMSVSICGASSLMLIGMTMEIRREGYGSRGSATLMVMASGIGN